jgi:two-component system alkaline phosphatase synthesis response regulator PhoP
MSYTLLLCETERHVRHALAFKLRQSGYAVLVADDADVALEMCAQLRPAVVVTDARLTRADGTPLHRALAAREPTASTPLVLLVHDEADASAEDCSGDRVTRVLSKPVGPTELLKAVGEILSPASAQAARPSDEVVFKRFAV